MQIFLIRDTKSNSVHATDTKKRTGCGINLQKPENMTKFSISGSVDDAFGLMTEVTCEKCQTVFTKRILKADRREMDRMLKEEKKRTKVLGDDPNMVSLADVQKERQKQEAKKAAAEARAAARRAEAEAEAAKRAAEAPVVPEVPVAPAAPAPVVTEVPGVAEVPTFTPPEPQFTQYVPPAKKEAPKPAGPAPTTTSYGGFALGDLAQFALPQTAVDPTAAAFAANEGKNPNILAQQQNTPAPPMPAPAPAGVMSNPNDILAQFSMPAPAPQSAPAQDDTLAQFAIPEPAPAPAPVPAEAATETIDDIMAQFGIPTQPTQTAKTETVDDILAQFTAQNAPAETPAASEAPVAEAEDDVMAQFSVPATPQAPVLDDVDDALAQFSVPATPQAPVLDDVDDVMAQFSVPATPQAPVLDDVGDVMAQFSVPAAHKAATPEVTAAPVVNEAAPLKEMTPEEQQTAALLEFEKIAERMFGVSSNSAEAEPEVPFIPVQKPTAEDVLFASAAPVVDDAIPEVPVMPAPMTAPVYEAPVQPAFTVPTEPVYEAPATPVVDDAIPEVPVMPAPMAAPVYEAPEQPAFTAPTEPVYEAPAAPVVDDAIPEVPVIPPPPAAPVQPVYAMDQMAQPMPGMMPQYAQMPVQGMPQMMQNPQTMQNMQPVPQFMGYDAQGQPMYTYVQPMIPQFMGYDAQGQPIYAPPAQPFPQAPEAPAAPETPAPAEIPAEAPTEAAPAPAPTPKKPPLISPMTPEIPTGQKPSLPDDVDRPTVEPMTYAKKRSQGVRVSKIEQNADIPDIVRSAVSKSAGPKGNIFDEQDKAVAVVGSIEDILSMMGEDTSAPAEKQRKADEAAGINLEYREYKPKTKKESSSRRTDSGSKFKQPDRPLTKEELKRQKREEKINAKFQKDLAKRGF